MSLKYWLELLYCILDSTNKHLNDRNKNRYELLQWTGSTPFAAVFLMPGDPKECREHAKQCLKLACETPSALAKAQFEALAQTWARLATDLERTKALVAHWGESDDRRDKVCG